MRQVQRWRWQAEWTLGEVGAHLARLPGAWAKPWVRGAGVGVMGASVGAAVDRVANPSSTWSLRTCLVLVGVFVVGVILVVMTRHMKNPEVERLSGEVERLRSENASWRDRFDKEVTRHQGEVEHLREEAEFLRWHIGYSSVPVTAASVGVGGSASPLGATGPHPS